MQTAELACPLCHGAFQVDVAWSGTQVACPHCRQAVSVPPLVQPAPPAIASADSSVGDTPVETGSPSPPPTTTAHDAKTTTLESLLAERRAPAGGRSPFAVRIAAKQIVDRRGQTVELKRRSPDESRRFRQRLHAAVALFGAAILALLLLVLLRE